MHWAGMGWWTEQSDFFHGLVDEVRFWDYARTAAQIEADLKRTVQPNTPGLVAYYRFDAPKMSNERVYRQALDLVPHSSNNGRILGKFV